MQQRHDAASHRERPVHWVPMPAMNMGMQLTPGAHFAVAAANNNVIYGPPHGTANRYSHGAISGYPGRHAQHPHQMHGTTPPGMDFSRGGGGYYNAGRVYNPPVGGGSYHPHGNMQHANDYSNVYRHQGRAPTTTSGRSLSRGGNGLGVSARDMGGYGGGGSNGRSSGPWKCPKCQNKNWSFRTECNRCSLRRPVGNMGGPGTTVYGPLPAPKGGHGSAPPWDCRCGNHNYGFRKHCNRCPLPRPGGYIGGLSAAVQAPRSATPQGGGPAVMDESTSNTVPAVVDTPTASQELWSSLVEFGENVFDTAHTVGESIETLIGLAAEQAEIGAKWTMERGKDALDMASEAKDVTASLIGQVAETVLDSAKEFRSWLGKIITWAVVCF